MLIFRYTRGGGTRGLLVSSRLSVVCLPCTDVCLTGAGVSRSRSFLGERTGLLVAVSLVLKVWNQESMGARGADSQVGHQRLASPSGRKRRKYIS